MRPFLQVANYYLNPHLTGQRYPLINRDSQSYSFDIIFIPPELRGC